jgi:hypothetical protein
MKKKKQILDLQNKKPRRAGVFEAWCLFQNGYTHLQDANNHSP